MKHVLFIDARNSARSPMAVAWFNHIAKSGFDAFSCGTMPSAKVDSMAVKVMHEVGLNLRKHTPKAVDQLTITNADIIVIMGPDVHPHAFAPKEVWDFRDPTGQPLDDYRQLREAIRARVQILVEELERIDHQKHDWDTELGKRTLQHMAHHEASNMILLMCR